MLSDRSRGSGGCSRGSRGMGLGCGSGGKFDDADFGGRPSLFGRHGRVGRDAERMGLGRESGGRFEDTPMFRRRRGSMSELMDGMGGMNLGGGGSGRGPLLGGGRSPLDENVLGGLGGRGARGPFLGPGMGMGMGPMGMSGMRNLGSRDGFLSPRSGLLGGGLLDESMVIGMGPMGMSGMRNLGSRDGFLSPRSGLLGGGHLGPGSRSSSSRASSRFDLHALDRQRMPYGPFAPHLSNYRSPYVEDYFSEIDPAEWAELEEMERQGLFWPENMYG